MNILDILNGNIDLPIPTQFNEINKLMGGSLQSPDTSNMISSEFVINTVQLFDDSLIDLLTTYVESEQVSIESILTPVEIEKLRMMLIEPEEKIKTKVEYNDIIQRDVEFKSIIEKIYSTPELTNYLVNSIMTNPNYISYTSQTETINYLKNYIDSSIENNSYNQEDINTVNIINSVVNSYTENDIENLSTFNESLKTYIQNSINENITSPGIPGTPGGVVNADVNNIINQTNTQNIENNLESFINNFTDIINTGDIFSDIRNQIFNSDLSKTNIQSKIVGLGDTINNIINKLGDSSITKIFEEYTDTSEIDNIDINTLNNIYNDSFIKSISNTVKQETKQDINYETVMNNIENINNQITNITNQVSDVTEKVIMKPEPEPQKVMSGSVNNDRPSPVTPNPSGEKTTFITPPPIPRNKLPKFNDIGKG